MNILITGIHGFVGTNLVQALKSTHTIYGLDIVNPISNSISNSECDSESRPECIKTYGWDELDALPPIDAVIHLAGKAHDTKNQTVAQTYFDINTGLTQKIYDWFQASTATKFIFFSSVKAAADKVDGILTEEVVPTPVGPYGESKIAAEKYILVETQSIASQNNTQCFASQNNTQCIGFQNQTQNTGFENQTQNTGLQNQTQCIASLQQKTYILRPCMIHGPGNKGNLNLLYNVVKKGIPYPLGAFENRRSFCSIDNLSFVVGALLEQNIESGIYNVGDDETLSTNELIQLIASTLNKPNRIWRWNSTFIRLVARVGSVLHLPLNEARLQKLTENYVVSTIKLKKALGIEQMPVRAKDGFSKTIASFME